MSAIATAAIVFVCIAGSVVAGMALRAALPEHHLSDDSRDVVKTGMALVATMAALVLGLLVASAKSSYDAQKDGLDEIAANITLLDRILEQYGPPAQDARESLKRTLAGGIARLWPADASQVPTLGAAETTAAGKFFFAKVLALAPENAAQTALHSQALQLATGLGHERLLLVAHRESSVISNVFLVVLSSWLVVLFASFGLFAPRNALVVTALAFSALSVSGAIFLILELADPFSGLLQISSAPLRAALADLGH